MLNYLLIGSRRFWIGRPIPFTTARAAVRALNNALIASADLRYGAADAETLCEDSRGMIHSVRAADVLKMIAERCERPEDRVTLLNLSILPA